MYFSPKLFLLIISLFIISVISGCGSDQSAQDSPSNFNLPAAITQAKIADNASIQAYLQVDNGTRQQMTVSGSNASIEIAGLSPGPHQFTITIEYSDGSNSEQPLILAQTSHTADISAGANTPLEFVDSDYNFQAFDSDSDGISNLDEVQTNNADLHAIALSSGSLNEIFDPAVTAYTASVAYEVTSIQVSAILQNSAASLSVNDVSIANDTESEVIELAQGSNEITVSTTSEDGTISKDYVLTITRLTPNNCEINPCDKHAACDDSTGTLTCTCNEGWTGDGFTCNDIDECSTGNNECSSYAECTNTPGAYSCGCKLGFSGNGFGIDGCCRDDSTLVVGENAVYDPNTMLNWNRYFTDDLYNWSQAQDKCQLLGGRLATKDELSTILDARFDPAYMSCTFRSDDNSILSVWSSTQVDDQNAFIAQFSNGTIGNDVTYNKAGLMCVASGSPPSTDDVTLQFLQLSAGSLNEIFTPELNSYTASVTYDTTNIQITANPTNTKASLMINNVTTSNNTPSADIALVQGNNSITVKVTSEDGLVSQEYSLTIIRLDPPDNNSSLQSLEISTGTFNETFQSNVLNYSATVDYAVTEIEVTANPVNNSASLKVNDVSTANMAPSVAIDLVEGSNAITVSVTSGDGTLARSYVITITRLAPSTSTTCEANPCDVHAACDYSSGSLTCTCNEGWTGDGFTCSDIDECLNGNNGCSSYAECTNIPGAYSCDCKLGFSGSGLGIDGCCRDDNTLVVSENTIYDPNTKLTWDRYFTDGLYNWAQAQDRCQLLGRRLATKDELSTILDARFEPAYMACTFRSDENSELSVWSSTQVGNQSAFLAQFFNGTIGNTITSNKAGIMCVSDQ